MSPPSATVAADEVSPRLEHQSSMRTSIRKKDQRFITTCNSPYSISKRRHFASLRNPLASNKAMGCAHSSYMKMSSTLSTTLPATNIRRSNISRVLPYRSCVFASAAVDGGKETIWSKNNRLATIVESP